MSEPQASLQVGDIVHYYISEEPRAALVTEVREGNYAALAVFYPNSLSFASYVAYSETQEPGTWCYPPKGNNLFPSTEPTPVATNGNSSL